jgi:hypothetical protein
MNQLRASDKIIFIHTNDTFFHLNSPSLLLTFIERWEEIIEFRRLAYIRTTYKMFTKFAAFMFLLEWPEFDSSQLVLYHQNYRPSKCWHLYYLPPKCRHVLKYSQHKKCAFKMCIHTKCALYIQNVYCTYKMCIVHTKCALYIQNVHCTYKMCIVHTKCALYIQNVLR